MKDKRIKEISNDKFAFVIIFIFFISGDIIKRKQK